MEKNKIITAIVVVVILATVAVLGMNWRNSGTSVVSPEGSANGVATRGSVPLGITVPDAESEGVGNEIARPELVAAAGPGTLAKFRRFSLRMENNQFVPATVVVGRGDSVMLNLSAIDRAYAFTLPDYGINVEVAQGETRSVRFGASAADKFMFYCGSCGGPTSGPVGYLIVVNQNK